MSLVSLKTFGQPEVNILLRAPNISTDTTNSMSGITPLKVIILFFIVARRAGMNVLKSVWAVASSSQDKMTRNCLLTALWTGRIDFSWLLAHVSSIFISSLKLNYVLYGSA
jgi:hypothetical protein